MDRLAKKYDHVAKAVGSFEQALSQYHKWQTSIDRKQVEAIGIDYEGIVLNLRDSVIQRFEYSIDLLWKYIKSYLKEVHTIEPDVPNPTNIIREASRIRIITEEDAEKLVAMIKVRNMTSHIYQEEIAEILSGKFASYLSVMQKVLTAVKP